MQEDTSVQLDWLDNVYKVTFARGIYTRMVVTKTRAQKRNDRQPTNPTTGNRMQQCIVMGTYTLGSGYQCLVPACSLTSHA